MSALRTLKFPVTTIFCDFSSFQISSEQFLFGRDTSGGRSHCVWPNVTITKQRCFLSAEIFRNSAMRNAEFLLKLCAKNCTKM